MTRWSFTKRFFVVALGMAALTLAAAAARAKSRRPTDQSLQEAARWFVDRLAAGDFAAASARFDMTMKGALPPAKLGEVWRQITDQAGPYRSPIGVRMQEIERHRVVFVTCRFERAALDVEIVFDTAGQIAGLFFKPPGTSEYRPTEAVREALRREREVTVGAGPWALPGAFIAPAGAGPFPGLVLVHGSGPQDRDETLGPNKPFLEIAAGLAERGVAVLRYDKRALTHHEACAALELRLTLKEETIDDAAAAVRLLQDRPEVDRRRVFALGHSLGGVALPRIAAAAPGLAGLIFMAAPARPLEEVLLDQLEYLASLGEPEAADAARLATLRRRVETVRALNPGSAAAADDLPLGIGPAYWLDLRAHPVAPETARLRRPILILQGGRDYQTTAADLEIWRRVLAGRDDVSIRLYPALNHLFIEGEGRATPAEYEHAGHVDPGVLDALASWITARRPAAPPPPQR